MNSTSASSTIKVKSAALHHASLSKRASTTNLSLTSASMSLKSKSSATPLPQPPAKALRSPKSSTSEFSASPSPARNRARSWFVVERVSRTLVMAKDTLSSQPSSLMSSPRWTFTKRKSLGLLSSLHPLRLRSKPSRWPMTQFMV